VVTLVAGGFAMGNNGSDVVLQTTEAADPGWKCYFGKAYNNSAHTTQNTGRHSGEHNVTPKDDHWHYTNFIADSSDDPYFYVGKTKYDLAGSGLGSIDADDLKYLVIRYYAQTQGKFMMYFGTTADPNAHHTSNYDFIPDSKWHDIVIDMSVYSGWTGTINSLRMDFLEFGASEYVYLSFIAAFDTVEHLTSWAKSSIVMGQKKEDSGTTQTVEKENPVHTETIYFGGTNGTSSLPATAGELNKVTTPGSGDFSGWRCIFCVKEGSRYRIVDYKLEGASAGGAFTVASFFQSYSTGIVIATANPAGSNFKTLWNYISQENYIKISGTKLTVYKVVMENVTIYNYPDIAAGTVTDHNALTTTKMTGTVSVGGGSTKDPVGTDLSERRFYRSNLSQYLTMTGDTTSMKFTCKNAAAMYSITLPDRTTGKVVAKVGVYYSSDSHATQNNKDGAIQWTYLPNGSDSTGVEINFQDSSTVSLGSYYNQDLGSTGYADEDGDTGTVNAAVYKGNDKYQYTGSFAHQVLPPGKYQARLEYDVLFNKYVKVKCTTGTHIVADPFDGANLREWPGAGVAKKFGTDTTVTDTDSLITTIPLNVDIYVGYDDTDKRKAEWWTEKVDVTTTASSGTMALYGGVFHASEGGKA